MHGTEYARPPVALMTRVRSWFGMLRIRWGTLCRSMMRRIVMQNGDQGNWMRVSMALYGFLIAGVANDCTSRSLSTRL